MKTLTREIKYTWLNRFSYQDREEIVRYYVKGFPILRIAKAFNTSQSTVKYHLKTKGVWQSWKKSTQDGDIDRRKIEMVRALTFPSTRRLNTKIDNEEHWYDEYGFKYKVSTKSYEDFLRDASKRRPILRSNDRIKNKGAGEGLENFRGTGRVIVEDGKPGVRCAANILSW